MRWLIRILISIGILIVISFGGIVLFGAAYSSGEAAGYDKGYSAGEEIGYSSGKKTGYDGGYISGKREGYNAGYTSGKADGYEEGYAEGAESGLGHGYILKDPTYKEVVEFLKLDQTNENKFVENTYVCSHFARDAGNNAEEKGLRCAFVEIRHTEQGHTIIAFDTIDRGLIYFEPQTDEVVKPVIGKPYYQCIEPRPGFYYEKPPHDDTIMDILVIW